MYDLVVVGGGPGGLAVARFAAEAGMKVILFERKHEITEVSRLCGQFTNVKLINVGGKIKYGYTEPLAFDIGTSQTRVHFPALGFFINYRGPLRPYCNYLYFSPSGNTVSRVKNDVFGFYWEKEALLRGLLEDAIKAGAEIVPNATATAIEDSTNGVSITVRTSHGEQVYKARKAIAADGKESRLVEMLGLNKKRVAPSSHIMRFLGYIMEGIETEHRINTWINFTIPSLNPRSNSWMYLHSGDCNVLATAGGNLQPAEAIEHIMKMPAFEGWFRHARIVRRVATVMNSAVMSPLMEPACGNVIVIGDAAALVETTIPGAIACGYMAIRSLLKEEKTGGGLAEYNAWWLKAFDTNDPEYLRAAGRNLSVNALCNDDEVDYLYGLMGDKVGVPAAIIASEMDRIKKEHLPLWEKLDRAGVGQDVSAQKLDLTGILSAKENSAA